AGPPRASRGRRRARQQQRERAAAPLPRALRERPPAVLARDRADDEEAEAAALRAHRDAGGDAGGALEDALPLRGGDADALVDDADGDALVFGVRELDADARVALRVLHGVVDQVPDGRLQLVGVAEDDRAARALHVLERFVAEVEARARELDALARDLPEVAAGRRAPPAGRSRAARGHHPR